MIKGPFQNCRDNDRFSREAHILSHLVCDGIVGLRHCFRQEKKCWIVLDYLPGHNLKDLQNKSLLSVDKAGWIIGRLGRLLEFCHQRGWAHCDICPENIQSHGSRIWLLDFGASLSLGQAYPWRRQVRPVWSSPALLDGKGRVSPADDTYSLTLLACQLLTGQHPAKRFTADTSDAVPTHHAAANSRWARKLQRPGRLSRRQWKFLQDALEHPAGLSAQDLSVQALGW